MLLIIKPLADINRFRSCFQFVEIEPLNIFPETVARKKGGIKFEGKSAEVIEKTYRKNV
jgi:hypothetical protein